MLFLLRPKRVKGRKNNVYYKINLFVRKVDAT